MLEREIYVLRRDLLCAGEGNCCFYQHCELNHVYKKLLLNKQVLNCSFFIEKDPVNNR